MPDGATISQPASSAPPVSDAMQAWVHAFTGVDPRGNAAAPGGAPTSAPDGAPGGASGGAPGGAPGASAPAGGSAAGAPAPAANGTAAAPGGAPASAPGGAPGGAPGASAPATQPAGGSAASPAGGSPSPAPAGDAAKAKQPEGTKWTKGAVKDDKGTGYGLTGAKEDKKDLANGGNVTRNFGGGAKFQVLVKQTSAGDPPKFLLQTTITFDASVGHSEKRNSAAPKDEPLDENSRIGAGGNTSKTLSAGLSASVAATASFRRELGAAEAKAYLETVKKDGAGSKLPEHEMLFTGVKNGAEAARKMWAAAKGNPEKIKELKPGEEIESSFEAKGGGNLGVNVKRDDVAVGASVAGSVSHKITVKKQGVSDTMVKVTAVIEDARDASASVSLKMEAGFGAKGNTGSSKGRTIVFNLNKGDKNFDEYLKMIDHAESADQLDKIAHDHPDITGTTTHKETDTSGNTASAMLRGGTLDLSGKRSLSEEETRDGKGNLVSSKVEGSNETGGKATYEKDKDTKVSVTDSVAEKFTGEVDKDGKPTDSISETHKHTDLGKTLSTAWKNKGQFLKDPKKAALASISEKSDTKAMALDDDDVMAICQAAVVPGKWIGYCGGGKHQDEWIEAGKLIRAAMTVKDGKVVHADKAKVNKALAAWTASSDGERAAAIKAVMRPLDGGVAPLRGKSTVFPDGTEALKGEWDKLMGSNPLDAARAKAKTDAAGALADATNAQKQLTNLNAEIKKATAKWKGFEVEQLEMLHRLTDRINDANKATHDIAKMQQIATSHGAESGKAQGGDDASVEVENYNRKLGDLKETFDKVFAELRRIEGEAKKDRTGTLDDTTQSMVTVRQQLQLWQGEYDKTYQVWQALSKRVPLDEKKLKELHPHGARQYFAQVSVIRGGY